MKAFAFSEKLSQMGMEKRSQLEEMMRVRNLI